MFDITFSIIFLLVIILAVLMLVFPRKTTMIVLVSNFFVCVLVFYGN
jgi:hypothetical protein